MPPTESKGRRHTSMISVAVIDQVEKDFKIKESDLEVKTQRGHGKGGQHQNTTDSAVRMKHIPTGISVFINGRDQLSNKKEARQILEHRVSEHYKSIERNKLDQNRQSQHDGGTRSNKIRTYNFIDDRATDHRSNVKVNDIRRIFRGRFDLLS